MTPFKPAEIRIIVLLSALVLVGSVLNLLRRQGRISDLDLGIFTEKKYYNYEYTLPSRDSINTRDTVSAGSESADQPQPESVMDLNSAGFYDLQKLPGIGPKIAQRIIAYRDSVGAFRKVDDLLNVNGIGPGKLGKIKDLVKVK